MTAERSAAPAGCAGALLVVAAPVVGVAVDGAATGGACTVGCELETTGADETGVATDTGVVTDVLPAVEGAAALLFREHPVTSAATIATPATATAVLERLT